jgi:hypothetical protein
MLFDESGTSPTYGDKWGSFFITKYEMQGIS